MVALNERLWGGAIKSHRGAGQVTPDRLYTIGTAQSKLLDEVWDGWDDWSRQAEYATQTD